MPFQITSPADITIIAKCNTKLLVKASNGLLVPVYKPHLRVRCRPCQWD